MGDRIARFDWSRTSIGPIDLWCNAMKSMLGFVLRSPVPIVTLWGDKGVMIYNDAYRSFAGARHPSLLGTNVLEGWHEVADFNANVMQKVYREGGTLSYKDQELTLIRDGTPKLLWTDLEYSPVMDEDGTPIGVVAIVIETTEKVLASRRLQDDRNRLWSISRDLLLVCTLEGTITAVNPSATRMLGWAEEDMVGHNLAEFIHPADLDRTSGEMASLGEGLSTLAFENRYRTREGDYRLLAWTAVPDAGRVHGVGRDITEERHLARDRDRIWNLSPVLKVVTDAQGYITDVNPSWTEKLGWSREETLGRRTTDFMVDDEAGWRERVATLRAGTPLLDYRTKLQTKDGDHRTIQWTTVPENDTFYGFGRDITAEIEAAAALADAEAALRQSQKMEAVGQLTGGIAHDFNNLLQGITGSLEIVQRRVAQGRLDELDRFIAGASTAASRAAALTHRLLAFSRRQPLDPKPVRANALVASMEDLLRRTSGERIELELVLAGGLWVTKCDPNQLESAILNLAINARDAMPDGGKLTIETCNAHLDRAYVARQRGVRPGQYVCLCVSDTGIGMSADTISKAFEPFFTTKPIGQGTGLGLSMIYGFAQQSEGYAKIYSEVGQGTTFKLYLPRYRGSEDEEEDLPQTSAMHQAEDGEVVLVVEDESVVRGLILEELHELGYAALEAVDGVSGLDMLQSKRRIDLLITDIGLPGLNGRQLADAARLLRPSLKILFMTGYAENAALASGFLEPGMEMITKPFAMEALATRIRSMLTEPS
ncbi:PAS domain S-box protein [Sphingobium sp. EP60837]|uniref:PAS domain S-box protein n=1 Tax=Sphingobium sp. EP60837 TaxID=1855519 RepID=UPI0007DDE213|nr:PAS domain S-box protein [Sphingobium sp. EP60837]ANI79703.1 Blue-light-activated protein [Sphingobium sp. EP60837]